MCLPEVHTRIRPPWLAREISVWKMAGAVAFLLAGCAATSVFAESVSVSKIRGVLTGPDEIWKVAEANKADTFLLNSEVHVEYYDPEWNLLWIRRDNNEAYFVPVGPTRLPIRSGQRVKINGTIVPKVGLSGDTVQVTVVTDDEPVSSIPIGEDLAKLSTLKATRVTAKAYVSTMIQTDAKHLRLLLGSPRQALSAYVHLDAATPLPEFTDALVELNGLVVTTPDPNGKVSHAEIWVSRLKDVHIVATLLSDPRFNIPTVSVDALQESSANHLSHVLGRVVNVVPNRMIAVRDETGQVEVEIGQTINVQPDDVVEAVGYPVRHGPVWRLERAFVRRADKSSKAIVGASASAAHLPHMHLADQVISLAPEIAAKNYPAILTGVVTWSNPNSAFFFLSDSSGSIQVERTDPHMDTPQIGTVCKITGVTAEGDYAPMISVNQLEVVGGGGLPEPIATTIEQALTGVLENRLIFLEGYVRDFTHSGPWMYLDMLTSGGKFTAVVKWDPSLSSLRGAVIGVRGVCTAVTDSDRQLTGVRIWVNQAQDITMEEAAPVDPFSIPVRSVSSLRRFSTIKQLNRRVHVVGTVIWTNEKRDLAIQDGDATLRIYLANTMEIRLGDRVDVVGLPKRDEAAVFLREAVLRSLGAGDATQPVTLNSTANIRPELDGKLVQLSGKIIDIFSHDEEVRLTLQAPDGSFEAVLDGGRSSQLKAIAEVGAEVSAVGIYNLLPGKDHSTHHLALTLRSDRDLHMIRTAPWWNAKRGLRVASITAVAFLLGLAWAATLRRRVRSQTIQLREQWEAEIQLKQRHQDILENASDFIYTVDRQGQFTSFNAAGEKLTGYTREEALNLKLHDLFVMEQPTKRDANDEAKQGRLIMKDGNSVWVEVSCRQIREGDTITGGLGIVRDISKRKQIEQELTRARDAAEATAKSKSAFLANMSHEIRTPMNGVIGMCNLLLDTRLDHDQKDFAETIRHSAEALLTVLNDILDFSKIEAGKLHFEKIDFDLRNVIEGSLDLLFPRASSKNLKLSVYTPPDLPTRLSGDPGRLRQVLLNLVGNAIKFTESGEVSITVRTVVGDTKSAMLRFEVKDTGIGLTAEAQSRLFAPFSQADESTTRRFGGTGLGLVISKQIVEMMEGEIGVQSVHGRGSTFWFTVKLARQAGGSTATPHESYDQRPAKITPALIEGGVQADSRSRSLRVLVAEDNIVNQRVTLFQLQKIGHKAELAADGVEVLEALERSQFDAILMDCQMPEMDGYEATRRIRANPRYAKICIIAMTANAMKGDREACLAAGMDDYISKPTAPSDLIAALERAAARTVGAALKTT